MFKMRIMWFFRLLCDGSKPLRMQKVWWTLQKHTQWKRYWHRNVCTKSTYVTSNNQRWHATFYKVRRRRRRRYCSNNSNYAMLTTDYFGVYLKSQNENASHNWAVIGSLPFNMRSDSLSSKKQRFSMAQIDGGAWIPMTIIEFHIHFA